MMKFRLNSKIVYTLAGLAWVLSGCSGQNLIEKSKQEPYPGHAGTTFDKVLSAYTKCDGKRWEIKELKTGEKFVEFTCRSTEPLSLKIAMEEEAAKGEAKDLEELKKEIEGIDARIEKSQSRGILQVWRHHFDLNDRAYSKAEKELRDFKAGDVSAYDSVEVLERNLAEARDALDKSRKVLEEKTAETKAELTASTEQRRTSVDKRWAEYRRAIREGMILITVQFHADTTGNVSGYAAGVDFDFGEWKYTPEYQKLSTTVLETIYQDAPILSGMRNILWGTLIDRTPGNILQYASRIAMDQKERQK